MVLEVRAVAEARTNCVSLSVGLERSKLTRIYRVGIDEEAVESCEIAQKECKAHHRVEMRQVSWKFALVSTRFSTFMCKT